MLASSRRPRQVCRMKLVTLLTITLLSVLNSYAQPGDYHRFRLYLGSTTRDSMFFSDFVNAQMLGKSYDSALVVMDTTGYNLIFSVSGGYSNYHGYYSMNVSSVYKISIDSPFVQLIPPGYSNDSLSQQHYVFGGNIAERQPDQTISIALDTYNRGTPMQYYGLPIVRFRNVRVTNFRPVRDIIGSFGQGEYLIISRFRPMEMGGEMESGFHTTWVAKKAKKL